MNSVTSPYPFLTFLPVSTTKPETANGKRGESLTEKVCKLPEAAGGKGRVNRSESPEEGANIRDEEEVCQFPRRKGRRRCQVRVTDRSIFLSKEYNAWLLVFRVVENQN